MASVSAPPRPDAPHSTAPQSTAQPSTGRPSAGHFAFPRRKRGGWAWAIVAVVLVLMLRLLPMEGVPALDRDDAGGGSSAAPASSLPSDLPGDSFPGSAYFFAQDAFAPILPVAAPTGDAAVTSLAPDEHSPHVLQIESGPAALSMPMRGSTLLDQARALQCMTNAIYYEAGNEPEEGQRAVAQVILNRLASGRWPNSVCGVIYQGTERSDLRCQFTFSCDGSMARTPAAASWMRARRVAARILGGEVFAPAGLATFYHTLAVHPPWAGSVRPVAVIGAHIFYRLPGAAGMPADYRMRYSGREVAQPGPYAFARPPRPTLLAPPGPEFITGWTMPPIATAPPTAVPGAAFVPVMGTAPTTPLPSSTPSPTAPSSGAPLPAYRTAPGSPDLPQSTIRPEYRNTGRPLR